ncbi:hypothetical protein [Streptomyces caeni]|uniref:hypothetical protein n=1 Tax=Streptomyces caeni TaxID=2307231 RepID=UPI0036D264ED
MDLPCLYHPFDQPGHTLQRRPEAGDLGPVDPLPVIALASYRDAGHICSFRNSEQ